MAAKKLDVVGLLEQEGMQAELSIRSPETPEERAHRLRKDFISFLVKEVAAPLIALLFVAIMGGYCCAVIGLRGVTSQEAKAVFPLLTSLFGAVVGMAFGRATK